MAPTPIAASLTRAAHQLDEGNTAHAVAFLVRALAAERARLSPPAWRHAVDRARSHAIHTRLREDPIIRRAVERPRGYPGDAGTLDYVYRCRPLEASVSPQGRAIHAATIDLPMAHAVRHRAAYLANVIRAVAASREDAVIVSVGCGHMRELHAIEPSLLAGASLVALDHDPVTAAALPTLHPGLRVASRVASVRALLGDTERCPEADLIYTAGLYDYLPDRVAALLTRRLAGRLRPGGILLAANLTPANADIAYLEAMMDWWMVYRDVAALTTLAASADGAPDAWTHDVVSVADGRVACLALRRAAAARPRR